MSKRTFQPNNRRRAKTHGFRLRMSTRAGRAILAQMPLKEREAIYRKLVFEKYSDTTPMGIEQIEAELRAGADRGYHQSNSEFIPDLAGVSFPIRLDGKRLSIVSAGPVSRCLDRRHEIAAIMAAAIRDAGFGDPGTVIGRNSVTTG